MKLLVASFAAVAMFVGFAATSNACGKDGKCVGKSSSSCCASKSKCSTKSACSTKASSAKKGTSTTNADDKVAPATTSATTVSATGK